MKFKVIDKLTGGEADYVGIAEVEEWAQNLCYCDMEGFALLQNGSLVLMDECSHYSPCPDGRFEVQLTFEPEPFLSL